MSEMDGRTDGRTVGRMDGWTEGRTDGRMNVPTENLPILQDFVPYRGRSPKRALGEKGRGKKIRGPLGLKKRKEERE